MLVTLNEFTLSLHTGDIFTADVAVIVVTATPDLSLSTEIGQAVLEHAGPQVADALDALGLAEEGQSLLTSAGSLPQQYIIHAVGPVKGSGNERGKLSSAIWSSLWLAENQQLASLAFTPISIGQFGYPVEGGADVMAQKVVDFTFEETRYLRDIRLYAPDPITAVFREAFQREITKAQNDTP